MYYIDPSHGLRDSRADVPIRFSLYPDSHAHA